MFDRLMAYACSSLESEALAEEAVQETFQVACQNPEKLCGSANCHGWLLLTLKNTIRNMKANRESAKRLVQRYLMTQIKDISFSEDKIQLSILYENVAETEEFKLLSELAIEGRSHEEMARSRGITVVACKKRLQRARERLQRRIQI